MPVLLQQAAESALPGGYGAALLQTLLALAAVCVIAWVVLRWGARRGLGSFGAGGRVRVLERTPLDARRALYLVQIGDKVLLLGAGEGGPPAVLSELSADEIPKEPERTAGGFKGVLERLRTSQDS